MNQLSSPYTVNPLPPQPNDSHIRHPFPPTDSETTINSKPEESSAGQVLWSSVPIKWEKRKKKQLRSLAFFRMRVKVPAIPKSLHIVDMILLPAEGLVTRISHINFWKIAEEFADRWHSQTNCITQDRRHGLGAGPSHLTTTSPLWWPPEAAEDRRNADVTHIAKASCQMWSSGDSKWNERKGNSWQSRTLNIFL